MQKNIVIRFDSYSLGFLADKYRLSIDRFYLLHINSDICLQLFEIGDLYSFSRNVVVLFVNKQTNLKSSIHKLLDGIACVFIGKNKLELESFLFNQDLRKRSCLCNNNKSTYT